MITESKLATTLCIWKCHEEAYLMLCNRQVVVGKKERMSQMSHQHLFDSLPDSNPAQDQYMRKCTYGFSGRLNVSQYRSRCIPPPFLSSRLRSRWMRTGRSLTKQWLHLVHRWPGRRLARVQHLLTRPFFLYHSGVCIKNSTFCDVSVNSYTVYIVTSFSIFSKVGATHLRMT